MQCSIGLGDEKRIWILLFSGALGLFQATGQVADPPTLPVVRIEDSVINENSGTIVFPVRLARPSAEEIQIPFQTGSPDDSASADSDYTATEGVLKILPGETQTEISIPLIASVEAEGTESFSLVFEPPTNALVLANHAISTELGNPFDEVGTDFGISVNLVGNTALVGAPKPEDTDGRFFGKIAVFVKASDGSWNYDHRLDPPDELAALYGTALATDIGLLATGGDQQLVLYQLSEGSEWIDTGARLRSTLPGFQWFTGRVALGYGQVAAQARFESGVRVLMFAQEEENWVQRGFLTGPDGDRFGQFGRNLQHGPTGIVVSTPNFAPPLFEFFQRVTVGDGIEWIDDGTTMNTPLGFAKFDQLRMVDCDIASSGTILRFYDVSWNDPPELSLLTTQDAAAHGESLKLQRLTLDGHICAVTYVYTPDNVTETGYGVRVFYKDEGGENAWGMVGDARKPTPIHRNDIFEEPALSGNRVITGHQQSNNGTGEAWITEWLVAQGTITDGAGVQVFVEPIPVEEPLGEARNVEVTEIVLAEPATLPFELAWETLPGTAEPGSDYIAASGTLLFMPGEYRKPIEVTLLPDSENELIESFIISVTPIDRATIREPSTEILVADATHAYIARVSPDLSVAEGNEGDTTPLVVAVDLETPSLQTTVIPYEIVQLSSPTDSAANILPPSGVLTIPAGDITGTLQMTFPGDSVVEGSAQYRLQLFPDVPSATGSERWREQARLFGTGDRSRTASHGTSVVISGDLMAVGNPRSSHWDELAGAVLVYRYDAQAPQGWLLEANLGPGPGRDRYHFGTKIALDGDTLMASAAPDFPGGGAPPPEVVIFHRERSGASFTWREVRRMVLDEVTTDEVHSIEICNNDAMLSSNRALRFLSRHLGGENHWGVSSSYPSFEQPLFRSATLSRGIAFAQTLDFRRESARYVTVFEKTVDGYWVIAATIEAPEESVADFGSSIDSSEREVAVFAGDNLERKDRVLIFEQQELQDGQPAEWKLTGKAEPEQEIANLSFNGNNLLMAVGHERIPQGVTLFSRESNGDWLAAAPISRASTATVWSVCVSGSRLAVGSQPTQLFEFLPEVNITVLDDDEAPVLNLPSVEVNETSATAEIRLTIAAPATRAYTFSYHTVDATAREGVDYAPVSGIATIARGGNSVLIAIPIINDTKPEQPETFFLEIDKNSGFSFSAPNARVTVIDDDLLPELISATSSHRLRIPQNASDNLNWMMPDFDDSLWNSGSGGIGYERSGNDFTGLIGSDVEEMFGNTGSVLVRYEFSIESPQLPEALRLRTRYDDGFVAWLNGVRVASRNGPEHTQWNSFATDEQLDEAAIQAEVIELGPSAAQALVQGRNVLAIQGLNISQDSSDFLLIPELCERPFDRDTDPIAAWLMTQLGAVPDAASPISDFDGDGLSGMVEYALQTDPAHPDPSPLSITGHTSAATTFSLRLPGPTPGLEGISYQVEYSTDLTRTSWIPIARKLAGQEWMAVREDVSLAEKQLTRDLSLLTGEWWNIADASLRQFLRLRVTVDSSKFNP